MFHSHSTAFIALSLAGAMWAATADEVASAARPAKTEESPMVAPGSVRVSLGLETAQGAGDLHARAGVASVSVGLAPEVDLTLEGAYLRLRWPSRPVAHGPGDPTVTMRARIARESAARPSVELSLGVKLPSGDHQVGLGTEETDFLSYLSFGHAMGQARVHLNVGFTIVGLVDRPHEQEDSFLYGVAFETPTRGRVRLLVDIFGEHLTNVRRNPFSYLEHYDTGALAALRLDLAGCTWDVGFFRPIQGGSHNWGATLGMSRLTRVGGQAQQASER